MQYLYSGGTHSLELSGNDADVLELMAAASFFQLEGLLRYTEARCAEIIDIDNVVAMYIHAKVSSDTFSVLLSPTLSFHWTRVSFQLPICAFSMHQ